MTHYERNAVGNAFRYVGMARRLMGYDGTDPMACLDDAMRELDRAMSLAIESCGSCAYANPDAYDDPSLVSCTHAQSFYHGHAMQATAKCEKWEAK